MAERAVLMFAYHFPPENEIGGARPFRFYKYLSRMGYRVQVFTAAEQRVPAPPGVHWIPDPFTSGSRRSAGWQMERAVRKTLAPGAMGTRWAWRASAAARAFLSANSVGQATVFSTFPPLGAHLAGWRTATGAGLPWIADFRDPMVYEQDSWAGLNSPQRGFARWLEKRSDASADAIIMNTDTAAEHYSRRHPFCGSRIHLLWNGFDPEDRICPLPLPARAHRLISHVGELYHGRTVTPLLESIGRLIGTARLSAQAIRIQLVGPAERDAIPNPDFIEEATRQGWLDLSTEPIPKPAALRIAQTSDGLLLLQPHSAVQVPGKLFEYLQIGRPILAFVMPDSPCERILRQSGIPYRCVYTGSAPAEVDAVVASFLDSRLETFRPSAWFEEQFNAERQTQTLSGWIESSHGGVSG
jgi:hypothetical protein